MGTAPQRSRSACPDVLYRDASRRSLAGLRWSGEMPLIPYLTGSSNWSVFCDIPLCGTSNPRFPRLPRCYLAEVPMLFIGNQS